MPSLSQYYFYFRRNKLKFNSLMLINSFHQTLKLVTLTAVLIVTSNIYETIYGTKNFNPLVQARSEII